MRRLSERRVAAGWRLCGCFVGAALCLTAPTTARADDGPPKLEWKPQWRRVNLFEGLALVPVAAALVAIETQWKPATEPSWSGGILGDDVARELLRGRTPELQRTAAEVSDWLFLGGVAVPIVIDLAIVTMGVHRKFELAWQMLLIDLQSLFMAGLLSLSSEHGVGRARPYVEHCDADRTVRDESGREFQRCHPGSDYKSFYSGHAAATATVAGLTCIHHQHLPLYGGGFADLAPCLVTIAVSVTTGMGRIIADKHWTSDVLLGWSIGALSGYILPALIHYGFYDAREVQLAPLAAPGGMGLSLSGRLD
jgi:membrane-associated phospholipid phosphatase